MEIFYSSLIQLHSVLKYNNPFFKGGGIYLLKYTHWEFLEITYLNKSSDDHSYNRCF